MTETVDTSLNNSASAPTSAPTSAPVEPDWCQKGSSAYALFHGAGAKTNLDSWLSNSKTDDEREKIVNYALWHNGRVWDHSSDSERLLGKYKIDELGNVSDSDWVENLKKVKPTEPPTEVPTEAPIVFSNLYVSSYDLINDNDTNTLTIGSDSYCYMSSSDHSATFDLKLTQSTGSYIIVPSGSATQCVARVGSTLKVVNLSDATQNTWKKFDSENYSYLFNEEKRSYVVYNVETGKIDSWSKDNVGNDSWKTKLVISEKPFVIPTTAAPANPELTISACELIEDYEFPSTIAINSMTDCTYMSAMYDSGVRFKFYYDDSTNSYTIAYTGKDSTYLVQSGINAFCNKTTSITDSYRWMKYDGTMNSISYSVLQNYSTQSYLIYDKNFNVNVGSASSSQSSKFVIASKPYEP